MEITQHQKPLPLGTMTEWGEIGAIASLRGERYYFMVDPATSELGIGVAMIPAMMVEDGGRPSMSLKDFRRLAEGWLPPAVQRLACGQPPLDAEEPLSVR